MGAVAGPSGICLGPKQGDLDWGPDATSIAKKKAMAEQFLTVEGRRLRVVTETHDLRSPWLVLWPGLGGTAEEFRRVLREGPHHGYNVAALDPPGHG